MASAAVVSELLRQPTISNMSTRAWNDVGTVANLNTYVYGAVSSGATANYYYVPQTVVYPSMPVWNVQEWNQTILATPITYYEQTYYWPAAQISYGAQSINVVAHDLTPEERERFDRWAEEQRVENEKREKVRVAAKERARRLLVSILSEEQRAQFEKENHFDLEVNGRLYRILPGSRVQKLDPITKKVKSHLCIHPHNSYELPGEDVAVSQKLLLESNEAEFLKLANEWAA